jgi:hypothetical protein
MNPILLLTLIAGGGIVFSKIKTGIDNRREGKANQNLDTDPFTNIASNLQSERESNVVEDSVVIDLIRQAVALDKDHGYDKLKAAYAELRGGKDLMVDISPYLDDESIRQINAIIGVAGGAKKPTKVVSSTLIDQITKQNAAKDTTTIWVVAKEAVRVRKTPVKWENVAILKHGPNWKDNRVATAEKGQYIGYVDAIKVMNNGGKFFYDDENDVWFVPVRVAEWYLWPHTKPSKRYTLYVALSSVTWTKTLPPANKKPFTVTQALYDGASNITLNGLGNPNQKPKINPSLVS